MKMPQDIVMESLKSSLNASLERLHLVQRHSSDDKRTPASDFVVLWKQNTTKGESWGTHRGTLRFDKDADKYRADFYWGHYDLTEEAALKDFEARCREIG